VVAALGSGCDSIQDAGTAQGRSGFDRTTAPNSSFSAEGGSGVVRSNKGLVALCTAARLPAGTPAEIAVLSAAVQAGLGQVEQDVYTPQLEAVVRSAGELLIAAQAQAAFASVDPALTASFRNLVENRIGSVSRIRAKLATACGERVPG
jgi:hypothetical protein